MDSASQIAEGTTSKSGDDKRSQASSLSTPPSPIATASSQVPPSSTTTTKSTGAAAVSVASTAATSTVATATSSIDDDPNEANIATNIGIQVTTTTSSPPAHTSSCPSSSTTEPRGEDGNQSDENKECHGNDKDTKKDTTADGSIELKSQRPYEGPRGQHEREQRVDCGTTQQMYSCETESKSSNDREGYRAIMPASLGTVKDDTKYLAMDVQKPSEDKISNYKNNCSSSCSDYKSNCLPSDSTEEHDKKTTLAPVEASSSTPQDHCSDSVQKNMSKMALPTTSKVVDTNENPSSERRMSEKESTERRANNIKPSVNCGEERIIQEPPITSSNGSVGSDDSHEGREKNDTFTGKSSPASVTSAGSTSYEGNMRCAVNSLEENSQLDRNKQFEMRSTFETGDKKQEMHGKSIEVATTTFAESRLRDVRKSLEVATVSSNLVDNPVASSSGGSNEQCNYSKREALIEKEPRDNNVTSDINRRPMFQASLTEPRMADCTSSSGSSSSGYGKITNGKETYNTVSKRNDTVDSSTGFSSSPCVSQAATTPVIASTNHLPPFNHQTPRPGDLDSGRMEEPFHSNSRRRSFDRGEHMLPKPFVPQTVADNKSNSANSYTYQMPGVTSKANNAMHDQIEVEAVSSSNCPSKPPGVELRLPGLTDEPKTEVRIASDGAGNDVITYQTSNQAIFASTIRHLFKQSAMEEGKKESKPKLPPFKMQPSIVHGNQAMPSTNSASTPYATHRPMSKFYHDQEKAPLSSQMHPAHTIASQQPNKSFASTNAQSVGSTNVPTSSYNCHPKDPSENWNHNAKSSSCYTSKISSTSHCYPTKSQPEISPHSTQNVSSLESIPRIPAMVDTVLAMKKSKPDPDRRHNFVHPSKDIQQPQKHPCMPVEPPRFYSSTSNQNHPTRESIGEQMKRRNSIYVENPDFSKAINHSQPTNLAFKNSNTPPNINQAASLSQLHMKPPDFSKVKDLKAKSESQKFNTPLITPENFAEISKKYNYVSDLRLKNPPNEEAAPESNATYSTLYMKAPQFSMQKFQNKSLERSTNINHSTEAENRCSIAEPEQVLTKRFPQLSEDVIMSVVPSKSVQQAPVKMVPEKKRSEYQEPPSAANNKHPPSNPHANNLHTHPRDHSLPNHNLSHPTAADNKGFDNREYTHHYVSQQQQHHQQQQMAQISVAGLPQRQPYPPYNYPGSQQQLQPQQHHPQQLHPQQIHPQQIHPQLQKPAHEGVAATTSVIQSSRSKDRSIDYPSAKPHERRETSPSYYQYMPQQHNHSPHNVAPTHHKTTSPVPVIAPKQIPAQNSIIQHIPSSPVNPNPSGFTNKASPSPGAMNPPYGWPSQSPNSRMGHSPVTSPHTPYRITQSPVGMNASSPHSPSFVQPSPSPTHAQRTTPTQTQSSPSPVHYKNPYMYAQPDPQRSNKNSSYSGTSPQQEKSRGERHYMDNPDYQPRHEQAPLLPSEYMLNQIQKPNPARPIDRSEGAFPSAHSPRQAIEISKNPPNYGKSNIKVQEKPNYREMINNVYALRNATSEEDLNYQIIKRTLNKDISIRRSENDLSKSIFDTMPGPSKSSSTSQLGRSNETLPGMRLPEPHHKYAYSPEYATIPKRYASNAATSSVSASSESMVQAPLESKITSLPICGDLNRNDISVTVSKVTKPPIERAKAVETDMQPAPRTSYVDNKELSTVVISKMKTSKATDARNAFTSRTRPPEPPPPVAKSAAFVSVPSKRESPLDLSVKTVKTKADSTGCDDSASSTRSGVSNTLKVDFAPNFSKHVRGNTQPDRSPIQQPQPTSHELIQRSTYAPSSVNASRQYPHDQQVAASHIQKAPEIPKQKDVYGGSYPTQHSKAVDPASAQYHQYHRQHEHMVQPPVHHQQSSQPDGRLPTYRTGQSVIEAVPSKYVERVQEQLTKSAEQDQLRNAPLQMPAQSAPYESYTKQQRPPPQAYERYPVQQQAAQIPYRDQRYPDVATSKYREAYQANNVPPVDVNRSDAYGRGMDVSQPTTNAQTSRAHAISKSYSESSMAPEKRPDDRKLFSGNDRRTCNFPPDQYAGKKRPLDVPPPGNNSQSQYHPPEKQVRVDELYRAHLAQTQYAQHQQHLQHPQQQQHMPHPAQQQHMPHPAQQRHQQGPTPQTQTYLPHGAQIQNHYERRDENLSPPRKEIEQITNNYPNQQYYETPYKQTHPQSSYPPPPTGRIGSERHVAGQGNPQMSGHQQHVQPDYMQVQQSHVGASQRPHVAYSMPPGHHRTGPPPPPTPEQHHYPPGNVAVYQQPRHLPVNMHQGQLPPNNNTIPNAPIRQSPNQRQESVVKAAPYQEHPAVQSQHASREQLKVSEENIHRRRQPEQNLVHPQNADARLPPEFPSHANSSYYTHHPVFPNPPSHPPAPSSMRLHPTGEQRDQFGEKCGLSEYPPANHAAAYQPPTIRSRENTAVTQSNPTWYPPIQSHPNPKHASAPENLAEFQGKEPNPPNQAKPFVGEMSMKSTQVSPSANNTRPQANEPLMPKVSPVQQQQQHTTGPSHPAHRGADQNVIDKLRTSIEMRGYEKQKSLIRKQAHGDVQEEECPKPDIASLLAARIRTKGELKGYTPIPLVEEKKEEQEDTKIEDKSIAPEEAPKPELIDPAVVEETASCSSFDLMDWGSTCNDFVEQLQTGVKKRSGKKRKAQSLLSDSNEDIIAKVEVKEDLPGIAYNCDIEQSLVEKIKSETMENNAVAVDIKTEEKSQQSSSSSDEDKPLHLLRQQSLTDVAKVGSENESSIPPTNTNTTTDQKSDGAEDIVSSSIRRPFLSSTSDSGNTAEKTSSVRGKHGNHRLKQEKRLAARLSKTSSSDSEDENKRNLQRPKKLIRKARSRASGASTTRNTSDTSDNEDSKRNLFRERLETRKRKIAAEKVTASSDPQITKKLATNILTGEDDRKIKLPIAITPSSVVLKREIITKAQIKCMAHSEKGESSCEAEETAKKEDENKVVAPNEQKEHSEEEVPDNVEESATAPKGKPPLKKSKLFEPLKIEETMTRSKRKKELEEQLANSKVLRNDKVIKNTPIKLKNKLPEKTPVRVTRSVEQKSSEEKGKFQISTRSSKVEKVEDAKRKLCEAESDSRGRKKCNKIIKEESSLSSSEGSSEAEADTVSKRVLLRRSRLSNESIPSEKVVESRKTRSSDRAKGENEKKTQPMQKIATPNKKPAALSTQVTPGKNRVTAAETNTDKFPPGWELEVYQYKRSLKIPQSLITIKGPAHHRVSTSLPDLDPPSSDASESFSDNLRLNNKQCDKKGRDKKNVPENQKLQQKTKNCGKVEEEVSNDIPESLEGKSIIDILHQRVPFYKRLKDKKLTRVLAKNEPRLLPRGTNKIEMLATPKTNDIYRGENHHIREIFGGEDRPASAPPELIDSKEERESKITFAKKYEEYLAAMNDVEFANRIRKSKKLLVEACVEETSRSSALDIPIKKEKLDDYVLPQDDDDTRDTEINACLQNVAELKTEPLDNNERDTPSIISERGDGVVTPLLFKRKKNSKIRSSRRKGSSGFDYIRKKKKPTPNNTNGQEVVKKKRNSPIELLTTRDENDISREIQRWVLNKGVGQSALHKAARLGYIDVIAYCLERMGLNADSKDNAGYTPLHEACSKGRLDIARLLLEYGANHSEVAASGIRPLHEASENGYIEIARLLLSYGADPLVTTYSGQTPLMLAEGNEMEQFIKNHLHDVQNTGPHKQPWKLPGPWYIYDPDTCGYDVLAGVPNPNDVDEELDDSLTSKTADSEAIKTEDFTIGPDMKDKFDTNSNSILSTYEERSRLLAEKAAFKNKLKSNCAVVLNNIDTIERFSAIKQFKDYQSKNVQRRRSTNEGRDERMDIEEETDGDGEMFEFEESEIPLPPLYLLKDEGAEKWVMLSDLCSLLKVKSKDTLLKQISPTLPPLTSKELLRELKMSDFLEKATCLQLLCAGEKLNIRSSKVVLVKYNEGVRNLLGVKTIVMKF